jgi:hypothetical protein
VASVSGSGATVTVKGNSIGMATITARAVGNASLASTCVVTVTAGPDIFVAGRFGENSSPILKNGVPCGEYGQWNDSDYYGYYSYFLEGNSLFVSDNDVYVVVQGGIDAHAALLKNGAVQQRFVNSCPYSIFVSGNDVYAAGYESEGYNSYATLWKNGIPQRLSDNYESRAHSVFVSGDDVCVAGHELAANGQQRAAVWKNGVSQHMNYAYNSAGSTAFSVFVSGGDVYVAGWESALATLWKNGVPQLLNPEIFYYSLSYAMSVFVSGGDVYVAGVDFDDTGGAAVTLWKNGVPQKLGRSAWGRMPSPLPSVQVSGNDVYVAVTLLDGNNAYAALWVNGILRRLSDAYDTYAASVVVR